MEKRGDMEKTQTICIVDDDRDILDLLSAYLQKHGYTTLTAEDAPSLMNILQQTNCDLIVLDVMLPGEDGFAVCRNIRTRWQTPIIFLTALNDTTDRIVGLELGGDDFMSKPFEPRELLARIRSVLRRSAADPGIRDVQPYYFAGWKLEPTTRCLQAPGGVMVHLSGTEYRLLTVFLAHPQTVLSRDKLIELTQGRSAGVYDRSIDVQISRLRTRLRDNGPDEPIIKTVRGDGYLLAVEVSHTQP